jgi:hypothetical protein
MSSPQGFLQTREMSRLLGCASRFFPRIGGALIQRTTVIGGCLETFSGIWSGSLDSYVPLEFLKQNSDDFKSRPCDPCILRFRREYRVELEPTIFLPGGRSVAHNVFIGCTPTKADRLSEAGLITSIRKFEGKLQEHIRDDITDGCCCGVTGLRILLEALFSHNDVTLG